ncbi:MAG: biopolymer transporter ExbD [Bdellovibrionales bacterium]|nr:biopolymer transporter ExbD [Bdellovibrionales bacterium]
MAGGSFRREEDALPAISEINVTPFVDVVLVLLVIFMVTAPMLVREQMSVNLPKAQSGEKSASQSIAIVIDKLGVVRVSDKVVSMSDLPSEIKGLLLSNPNAQAVISADQEAKHGDVVQVMDLIKSAGLTRFAIQIERK